MEYIQKFITYDNNNINDIYINNKIGAINILFIGSCRSTILSIYFEELCKNIEWFENYQFGISVIEVHVIKIKKRSKTNNNLKFVIENADYIVCEQIRSYDFLNTNKKCIQNIFNNFDIKKTCKIIQIQFYSDIIINNNSDLDMNIKIIYYDKKL
jgi:hypothetical protein